MDNVADAEGQEIARKLWNLQTARSQLESHYRGAPTVVYTALALNSQCVYQTRTNNRLGRPISICNGGKFVSDDRGHNTCIPGGLVHRWSRAFSFGATRGSRSAGCG